MPETEICLPVVLFSQLAHVLDPESRSYRKAEGLLSVSVLAAWLACISRIDVYLHNRNLGCEFCV